MITGEEALEALHAAAILPDETYSHLHRDGFRYTHKLGGDGCWEVGDDVKNPVHYTSHPSGIECWDVTRHMNFNLGNAFKYIWRCDLKGKPIEDLEKAVEYLQDEIAMRKKAAADE